LFPEQNLPRLNDTEEALLHYMRKCSELESEIRELRFELYGDWISSGFDPAKANIEGITNE
jgi:hypothetical protein